VLLVIYRCLLNILKLETLGCTVVSCAWGALCWTLHKEGSGIKAVLESECYGGSFLLRQAVRCQLLVCLAFLLLHRMGQYRDALKEYCFHRWTDRTQVCLPARNEGVAIRDLVTWKMKIHNDVLRLHTIHSSFWTSP